MMSQSKIHDVIKILQRHPSDSGSLQAQIAQITFKISNLIDHLRKYPDNLPAKRSLLLKIAKRRKLLSRLEPEEYEEIVSIIKDNLIINDGSSDRKCNNY